MPLIDLQITSTGCVVVVSIHVSAGRYQALQQAGQVPPPIFNGRGLVDPGASITSIDPSVVKFLGLQPTGLVPMVTPSTGSTPHLCNQYDVSVWFPQAPTLVHAFPVPQPIPLDPARH